MIKRAISWLGYYVGYLKNLKEKESRIIEIDTLFDFMLEVNGGNSKAQLKQDVFALMTNRFKRGGFFVEFGAADGVRHSNTHVLEKHYGWSGILAEPAKTWHEKLKQNIDCSIDFDCVWTETGKTLDFNMAEVGELSTLAAFSEIEGAYPTRGTSVTYGVNTISLIDLLQKYGAPKVIEYMSVDTEGSEYEILNAFDFGAYRFNAISIEHAYGENRDRIRRLMEKNGYRRLFEHLSKWDDWYVPV